MKKYSNAGYIGNPEEVHHLFELELFKIPKRYRALRDFNLIGPYS